MKSIDNQHIFSEFLEAKVSNLSAFEASTTRTETKAAEVCNLVKLSNCGAILVVNQLDQLQGIITERDLLQYYCSTENFFALTARDLMTKNPITHKKSNSVARLLNDCAERGFRHVPVVHASNYSEYLITSQDILNYLYNHFIKKPGKLLKARMSADHGALARILNGTIAMLNPAAPIVVNEQASINTGLNLLIKNHIGSVLVIDAQQKLKGIFSESDFTNKFITSEQPDLNTLITKYCTLEPIAIEANASIANALSVLAEGGFRHLPIVDQNKKATGILSVRNFIKSISRAIVSDISAFSNQGT